MKFSKKIILTLLILLSCTLLKTASTYAQGFSYVLIQGDKKTPIYTKVEGTMMPRYGKNYALLSRLAPGPLNLEILFQQNEYPPLQFNILVPEAGKRAFVLQQKDGTFQLFDVEQNFYLMPNNNIDDDHLPSIVSNAEITQSIKKEQETTAPIPVETKKEENTITPEITIEATPEVTNTSNEINAADSPSKPTFIEEIVFDNNTNKIDASAEEIKTGNQNNDSTKVATIENSDCNGKISNLDFLKLSNIITNKKTEDEKLGLVIESSKKNCFSTEQCEILLQKLDTDVAKFSAIKSLYPKTTDQSNFIKLSTQLQSDDWKEAFQNLLVK